jgi:hypothetical protein
MHPSVSLRQLLVDPAAFFAAERDSWLGGALAVGSVCALALASLLVPIAILLGTEADLGVAESFPAVRYVSGEASVVLDGRSLGIIAIVTLAPVPILAGFALLFHLLSWPVAARGSLTGTARMTAWGAVPLAVANALTLFGTLLALPIEFEKLGYAYVTLTGRTIVQQSDPSLFLLGLNLLGVACVCWAAVIWLRGLEHVRGCSSWQAAAIVGLPVAAAVSVNVSTLLYGFVYI